MRTRIRVPKGCCARRYAAYIRAQRMRVVMTMALGRACKEHENCEGKDSLRGIKKSKCQHLFDFCDIFQFICMLYVFMTGYFQKSLFIRHQRNQRQRI